MKKLLISAGVILGMTSCTSYKNYYNSSRTLIEEMIANDEAFYDTIAEGDLYDQYINAKRKLPKIIKKQIK